jgi:hypothetical protein
MEKYIVGTIIETETLRVEIQKARADYYETLETDLVTGEKTNGCRGERFISQYIGLNTSLMKGTKEKNS